MTAWTLLAAASLQALSWMAGGWELREGNTCTEEYWTQPAADTLIGMSRTIKDGRTQSFEFMRIEARADGIYYVAQRWRSGHGRADRG